jgi:hypothetical protein
LLTPSSLYTKTENYFPKIFISRKFYSQIKYIFFIGLKYKKNTSEFHQNDKKRRKKWNQENYAFTAYGGPHSIPCGQAHTAWPIRIFFGAFSLVENHSRTSSFVSVIDMFRARVSRLFCVRVMKWVVHVTSCHARIRIGFSKTPDLDKVLWIDAVLNYYYYNLFF